MTTSNTYWVEACNSGGCTNIDSENPATFVDTRPSAPPGHVEYRRDGSVIVVDWNAVPDADYYRIFYDDYLWLLMRTPPRHDRLAVRSWPPNVVGTLPTPTPALLMVTTTTGSQPATVTDAQTLKAKTPPRLSTPGRQRRPPMSSTAATGPL